jgi:hypothetical protein
LSPSLCVRPEVRSFRRPERRAGGEYSYVPPKEEEEEEPIDPRLEKQMEGKMYYEILEVDRAAGA